MNTNQNTDETSKNKTCTESTCSNCRFAPNNSSIVNAVRKQVMNRFTVWLCFIIGMACENLYHGDNVKYFLTGAIIVGLPMFAHWIINTILSPKS